MFGLELAIVDLGPWIVLGLALAISAFVSAAESALFSLGATRVARMEEEGVRAAPLIKRLLAEPSRLLVTLTLVNDAVNVLAVVIVTWLVIGSQVVDDDSYLPSWLFSDPTSASLVVSLMLIMVFAQTLPKALGVRGRRAFSQTLAYPVEAISVLVSPARVVACAAADLIMRGIGTEVNGNGADDLLDEDIRELVEAGSREGLLDVTERELLVNLLHSGEVTAADVMTPRHEIVAVSIDADGDAVRDLMKDQDYSRITVFEGGPENFVGVITAKDLLRMKLPDSSVKSLKEVIRPLVMVPPSRRVNDLLVDFRRERIHLALVVDEFGAVSGLVTMEDVLEEIFGEIKESGAEPELVGVGEDQWRVLGAMETADFNKVTGARVPGPEDSTLAGLVLSKLGRKPRPGDEVEAGGFKFKVLEVRGILIHRLEVKREAGP